MQMLEIDWLRFLDDLPHFQRLPYETRRLFLERVQPAQQNPLHYLADHFEILRAAGLLFCAERGEGAVVAARYRAFCRVVQALYQQRIFDFPSRRTFDTYFNRHFTKNERLALYGYGGYYHGVDKLYSQVSSVEWLEEFLTAPEKTWQARDWGWGQRQPLSPEVVAATQALLRRLMGRDSPIALKDLRDFWPEATPALLSPSLVVGMRSLLFFPGLFGEDLEPVLGIWPTITRTLFRVTHKPPEPVTPQEVFEAPFLMDDMAAALALCAAEPFRLRTVDFGLFARAEQAVIPALVPLPAWVARLFNISASDRLGWAITFLKHHRFVRRLGKRGFDLRLELADAGRKWLGLPPKERLKTILDRLLQSPKKRSTELEYGDDYDEYGYDYDYAYDKPSLLPYPVTIEGSKQLGAVRSAVLKAFAGLTASAFVPQQQFVAYHCQQNNPLAPIAQRQPYGLLAFSGSYGSTPTPEELEDAWGNLLGNFLRLRLLPLGAAKIGLDAEGAVCFTLTDAGRYLVGAQPDFHFERPPARIVVQPNFDVVFLAPDPSAEAVIGCFAERKGRQMGTLFKITKRSILTAAAAGITAEQAFETLRQCCFGEIPPNVQREISGWFAQCRRAALRRAVLIQCPDAETAARIRAVAGRKVTPVAEAILELQGATDQLALLRKLREAGIFVSTAPDVARTSRSRPSRSTENDEMLGEDAEEFEADE
jgi:hypothetical protein